jgi:hypothetical protein
MKTTLITSWRTALPLAATLALFASTSLARDYFITPNGAGSKNGSSWANAYSWSDSATNTGTILNQTMEAGDRLLMGSGTYDSGKSIYLNSSGTSSARKTVEGVDRGGGLPVIDGGNWSRTNPDNGTWSLVSLNGNGPDYWTVKNLVLRDAQHGIYAASKMTSQAVGNQFIDITIRNVRHGVFVRSTDSVLFRRVNMFSYAKQGLRLEGKCDNVTIEDCVADMSEGDTSWYDHSEEFPFGFLVEKNEGPNTNVSFFDCDARNHRKNGQPDNEYWNGDGFVVEGTNTDISFNKCRAYNNEDGGYDLKPAVFMKNCVAVNNKRNFRFWTGTSTANNCVSSFTSKRGGSGGRNGFWVDDAKVTLNYCTAHDTDGTLVSEQGAGSADLGLSILSLTGSNGSFRDGSGTETTTTRYRPGSGTNPRFVSPSSTWLGLGTNMNTLEYGSSRGYSSTSDGYSTRK